MIQKINIRNQEWFKVVCDNCYCDCIDEEAGQCLMPDELSANNLASDEGWSRDKDTHICPNCIYD